MKDLKKYFPMLKKATTKNKMPFFGGMIKFDEDVVETCNNLVYTCVNYKTNVRGCTDFFVLEKTLGSVSDNVVIEQVDDVLKVVDGKINYELIVDDIDFPEITFGKKQVVELDNELYHYLNLAKNYTAKEDNIHSHPYIYLSSTEIVATKGSQAFYKKVELDIDTPIPILKEALTMAKVNDKIGVVDTNGENNFILVSENAQTVFSGRADIRNTFPVEQIRDFIDNNKSKFKKIDNIQPIVNAVNQVSAVLVNEKEALIDIEIKEDKVIISCESATSGKAETELNSYSGVKGKLSIRQDVLRQVPPDFDFYVDVSDFGRRIILANEDSYILMSCG